MMNRNVKGICTVFITLTTVVLLSMCGKEDINPGPGPSSQTIKDEERLESLKALDKKANELNNLKNPSDKAQFIAWLTTRPEFVSFNFDGSSIFALYADGRIWMHVDMQKDDGTGGRMASGGRAITTTVQSNGRAAELPGAAKATLFNGMGKFFPDNTEDIEKVMKASKSTYTVERKKASIENLKAVKGDGFFYYFTHGGGGYLLRPGFGDSLFFMSLWTTDSVTVANEKLFKDELDNRRMTYMQSTWNDSTASDHYGITSDFIKEHMEFGANSIVYMDACNTFRSNKKGSDFRQTVIDKAANKNATYIGWSLEANYFVASRASQFIVDRLLGANTIGFGQAHLPNESPSQRPFDLDPVFADLHANLFDICANGAQLKYETKQFDQILLAPSIEYMEVDEFTTQLLIHGLFGSEKGKIVVDGIEPGNVVWSPELISCTIPESGQGSAGYVQVSVRDMKSNVVPITRWVLKINYSLNDDGIELTGTATLNLRADVHPSRKRPHEDPKIHTPQDYGLGSGRVFGNSSSATYIIGGAKTQTCNVNGCEATFTYDVGNKSGALPYIVMVGTVPCISAIYNWGAEQKFINFTQFAISLPSITSGTFTERVVCPDPPIAYNTFDQRYSTGITFPNVSGNLQMEMGSDYIIVPGSASYTIPSPWGGCSGSTTTVKVQWSTISPAYAPNQDTPARKASSASAGD